MDKRVLSPIYDVFVDLTSAALDRPALEEYLDCLARDAGVAGSVTLAVRAGTEPRSVPAGLNVHADCSHPSTMVLSRAIGRAANQRRHLVVLLGPLVPSQDVLSALIEVFDRDPMFGTAQPRFAEDGTDRIWPLPGAADRDGAGPGSSRVALRFVPDTTITPELLAACMVLRWNVLTGADPVDHRYAGADGALLQLLCQTRRRGLRNVVVNRALVPSRLSFRQLYPAPAAADREQLRRRYPDHDLAEAEITGLIQRRLEPLLAAAHVDTGQRRILLDCRGLPPRHNGSAQCVLGFLDGFAELNCSEQIEILVWPDVAAFHRLKQRYPNFRQVHAPPTEEYFAAVSLTQPWELGIVTELHRHALVLAVTMLDTIAWDVLYPSGADGLGTVWRFIARHADGLLYNSHFTRERFITRFPPHSGLAEQVTHHSLLMEEHVHPAAQSEPVSDYILVFGNEYEHKDLRPTLQLLVDAFPFNRIVAFGVSEASGPNVLAMPSGQLAHAELHRVIAAARVIVFPSFYEGFGLPVVEGLAYGRPVVVRRSPLWAEIAGWSRLPGSLLEFDDAPSLVENVGRVLAGLPTPALPSGARLANDATPVGWRDCAARVIALLNNCLASADGSRWREREEALRTARL